MAIVEPKLRTKTKSYEPLWQMAEASMGFVPNSMLTMVHRPAVAVTTGLLAGATLGMNPGLKLPLIGSFLMLARTLWQLLFQKHQVNPAFKQLLALAVSLGSGCRYCQAHTTASAEHLSVGSEKIADLLRYEKSPHYTPAERAALAFTFAAVQGRIEQGLVTTLRRYYQDPAIVEIVSVISMMSFLNRWNDTMETTLETIPTESANQHLANQGWQAGKHKNQTNQKVS